MGKVIIQKYTTLTPITMIGEEAGICQNSDTSDNEKNYRRGLECLKSEHGRTFEFPDVYFILDGYSARVIREWYTHIGGLPTRLQESTRYVDYTDFEYYIPESIKVNEEAKEIYVHEMDRISLAVQTLIDQYDISNEDAANLLPLGMNTKVVCKYNLRTLIDMSHQRMCSRAYKEYRELFASLCLALCNYSEEWKTVVTKYFVPKCEYLGRCPEKHSCGRFKG